MSIAARCLLAILAIIAIVAGLACAYVFDKYTVPDTALRSYVGALCFMLGIGGAATLLFGTTYPG